MITTWKKLIGGLMETRNDSWENVVACTLSDEELNVEFDDGFGSEGGKPFTLWTKKRVYFPACYDGSEWVGSVPRKPNNEITEHVGG